MRLYRTILEAEADEKEEKDQDVVDKEEKDTEEPEPEVDDSVADIEKIVDMVVGATDKNGLNSAVQSAGSMAKQYGKAWLGQLKKALLVDVQPETVDRFIDYATKFSEKLTHLK
jgi:hypothetical protein